LARRNQVFDLQQIAVAQHRLQRRDPGVGAQHEDAVETRLLGQFAGIDLEGRAGLAARARRATQVAAVGRIADQGLIAAGGLLGQPGDDRLPLSALAFCFGLGAAQDVARRAEAEAERERNERQAIIAGLAKQLARGDKALTGNSAYRRYLRRTPSASGEPGPAFEIDPGKLAEEARYDGLFVLRTNARIMPLQAVLRYRDLLQVEDLFRRAKAILRTRPIYHSSDAAIRGHVFCSFLALMLQKELADLCHSHGLVIEWADLLRDLDRPHEATIEKDGKRITTRTAVAGQVGSVFQAAGIALPPNLHERAA